MEKTQKKGNIWIGIGVLVALGSLYINYHCSTLADHQLLLTAGYSLLCFFSFICRSFFINSGRIQTI